MMAHTIAVHHAGPGETLGGYPRVKIWCDILPNLALKTFFDNVANGIEGIVDIHTSTCDHAHVELIIEPTVNVEMAASKWISDVNERLGEMSEEMLEKFFLSNPDALARHSATSAFHGADRSN